jgi:hypothetical protein
MNNKNNNDPDAIMEELQTLWDRQSQRVDNILTESSQRQPKRLNIRYSVTRRHKQIVQYITIIIINAVSSIAAYIMLTSDSYFLYQFWGYILSTFFMIMTIQAVYTLVSILRNHPALTVTSHTPHFHNPNQVVTVTSVAFVVLIGLLNAPKGDELAMTKVGHADRYDVIVNIDKMIVKS